VLALVLAALATLRPLFDEDRQTAAV